MKYDFDKTIDRRATNSYKWDSAPEGVLPMWVADMDFRTAPAIIDALQKRVAHGIFGADMKIDLVNDGPFTIVLDTDNL